MTAELERQNPTLRMFSNDIFAQNAFQHENFLRSWNLVYTPGCVSLINFLISALTLPLSHLAPVAGLRKRKCLSLYLAVSWRYNDRYLTGHRA